MLAEARKVQKHAPRSSGTKPTFWSVLGITGIAACVALLLTFNFKNENAETVDFQMLDNAFCNLSNEEQDRLLAIYQADIFINNSENAEDNDASE